MNGSKDKTLLISPEKQRRAIFLDRDGVINIDHGYVHKVEDLQLINGVGDALVELKRRGFCLIVISNQSGVGRGYFGAADVEAFNEALQNRLKNEYSISLDGIYVCYDAPSVPSTRRKPAPGMILEAANDHSIDLSASWMVGDRDTDVLCAIAAGVRALHVTNSSPHPQASAHASSLAAGLPWLV